MGSIFKGLVQVYLKNSFKLIGLTFILMIVYFLKYPMYISKVGFLRIPSPGYFTEVTVLPILMILIIHIVSKTMGGKGLELFDKKIGTVYISQAIVWLPLIFLQTTLFELDIFYFFKLRYVLGFSLPFLFMFVAQSIILNNKNIKDAFRENFKFLQRHWIKVIICCIVFYITNRLISRTAASYLMTSPLLSIFIYNTYNALRFVFINILMTVIFINDDTKQNVIMELNDSPIKQEG